MIALTASPFLMRSPRPLTNICGFSTKKPVISRTLYKKQPTPLFIAKIPSTCNRNLDLSYVVNLSGLFYDDKYSSNDKQRQVGYNGPSSVGHN